MDKKEFLREQFITLRDEAKATKARLFWILALGLFGVPLITYLAENAERCQFLSPMIPYLVIVLLVMFLAEQNALMRAGRYVREQIEPNVGHSPGWEAWLETSPMLRLMDKHLFAVFTLVFFAYYFMSIGFAIQTLWSEVGRDSAFVGWLIGAAVTYAIGGVWGVFTLLHHWRTVTTTRGENEEKGQRDTGSCGS